MTGRAPLPYDFMSAVPSFELRSDDVADGQMMPQRAGSQPGGWPLGQQPRRHECPLASVKRSLCRVAA